MCNNGHKGGTAASFATGAAWTDTNASAGLSAEEKAEAKMCVTCLEKHTSKNMLSSIFATAFATVRPAYMASELGPGI